MSQHPQNWKRKFAVLWLGQAVSLLTSSVLQMAIVWYLTARTGSAALLSFAMLIGFLPQAVLGLFIGALIDRHDRKRIMIASDIFIAAASLVLMLSGLRGEIPIWLIMAVLFARSIGTAFHYPSLQAVTPLLVPREHITKYAGYSQGFESVSMVISPPLAAVLFSVWSLSSIIFLDVLGALFAVGTLCCIAVPRGHADAPHTHVLQDARDGLRVLRTERGMISLLLVSALYAIIYFPIGTLYPLITMTYFGGGVAESSVVEVLFSIGMLLGSLLLGALGGKLNRFVAIIGSMTLYGTCLLLTGLLPPTGLPFFIVLSALLGLSVPFFTGVQTAIFQTKIKAEYLGRIFSLSSSISMLAMPLGLILAGAFSEIIGTENWFLLSGVLTLLLAVGAALLPSLRHGCDDAPAP